MTPKTTLKISRNLPTDTGVIIPISRENAQNLKVIFFEKWGDHLIPLNSDVCQAYPRNHVKRGRSV